MPLHVGKGRTVSKAIGKIIGYVENPEKTDHGKLISSFACDSRSADAEFLFAKQQYIQHTGRQRGKDDVIAYHVRQAFVPGEITAEKANEIGVEFAKRFTKGNHAFVVCTHIDKAHIHNHIIWSAVNTECDRKFRNFWGSSKAVRALSDTLCIENGLSIIEDPAPHGLSYNKWLGRNAKPSHREQLRATIDQLLQQKPADLPALLDGLRDASFAVTRRGNAITLKHTSWARPVRLGSLGDGYTEDDLIAILSGKKSPSVRSKNVNKKQPEVNLLIDIQAKLQSGKGGGYARWATVFNLKQMAQTMNYLREHDLLNYSDLASKAESTTARYNELSGQIKSAETRMAEISVLRTHIINYVKTKDVYVEYRKAGYSKKFLADHEADIALHKAAKKAFDEQGLKKLPTVKNLQTEYAELLTQKKAAYQEYRAIREEMKSVLNAKANVDKILQKDEDKILTPEQDR